MSNKSFSPHSRQQDERLITRYQKDFSAGMFDDIPASSIPDDGVAYLKNFDNYGDRLVGRSGCKEWGDYGSLTPCADLPSYATGIDSESTASGNIRTVIINSGYSFTADDIGSYFVHDDGTHERILSVTSTTEINTRSIDSSDKTSSAAWLRGQVNGMYFHKFLKKIILHIGSEIYIARDIYISAWDLTYCSSYASPSNELSFFDEVNNDVFLFNSNGVYKIDISQHPSEDVFYYKINTHVPTDRISDTGNNLYKYRYLYSLSRLDGSGERNRQSTGVSIKTDSGTCLVDSNYKDYGERQTGEPIDGTNTHFIDGLTIPLAEDSDTDRERHWTHFSIWRTADIGTNGVDPILGEGNNPELYAWVEDVPVSKSFTGTITGTAGSVDTGYISEYDVGSDLYVWVTSAYTSHTITDVDESAQTFTIGSSVASPVVETPMYIGATAACTFSADAGVLTPDVGDTFTSDDIGRTITTASGLYLHIIDVSGGNAIIVEQDTIAADAGCWGEGGRGYRDSLPDEDLRPRFAGYPLFQRLYEPIPTSDMGVITGGMLYCAELNGNYVYYSQVPDGFEYLAGYYHPQYQLFVVKDSIRAVKEFSDRLAVYCANSTTTVTTNTYSSVSIPTIGVEVAVVSSQNVSDASIGVLDYGSIYPIDTDKHIMITNEPAIRVFDGYKYSDNLASQRIMNILRSLRSTTSAVYIPNKGYSLWGCDEQ